MKISPCGKCGTQYLGDAIKQLRPAEDTWTRVDGAEFARALKCICGGVVPATYNFPNAVFVTSTTGTYLQQLLLKPVRRTAKYLFLSRKTGDEEIKVPIERCDAWVNKYRMTEAELKLALGMLK